MRTKTSDAAWRSGYEASGGAKGRTPTPERAVRITHQFRERRNMTYELDCSGTPLVIRVFFPDDSDGSFRLEVSANKAVPASVVSASAGSKAQALQLVAQNWREATRSVSSLDWDGIAQAMTSVRAL